MDVFIFMILIFPWCRGENMFRLDSKIALITGGATGIGQAIAVSLAAVGADVAVADRRLEAITEAEFRVLAHGRRFFKTENRRSGDGAN
jgi:NAD(P)-dependent dehydrogenase (short-subunit alcohol dehydrogenase family)